MRAWARPLVFALALACLAVGASARGALGPWPTEGSRAQAAPAAGPPAARPEPATPGTARFIVQLSGPPLALRGRPPLRDAPASASPRFAPPASHAAADLAREQAAFLRRLGRIAPSARPQQRYEVAFNGFALRLDAAQVAALRRLPGVRAVTPAERVRPLMDASLPLVGAPEAWADPRVGGAPDAGRGMRIAVIDSGITAAHPLFAPGELEAPPGFPRAAAHVGSARHDYPPERLAELTNGKVIAARVYANPELLPPEADPLDWLSPLADNPLDLPLPLPNPGFHGAHVAGTAAGAVVEGAPGDPGTGSLPLSGVAPGAHLMAYKFNDAYTPELLAMIDDAVADGAHVINNSWGTSLMNLVPAEHHPVAEAFAAARAAGVVVVAAAGNAGQNGEATLGGPHQMSPDVITVANSGTGRSFAYTLTARDDDLPAELEVHPTAYEPFDNAFDVIDRRALVTDLCNPVQLLLDGPGRTALARMDTPCEESLLPIQLPGVAAFVEKMVVAALGGVDAVVFYQPEGDIQQMAAALAILELLAPLLEGIVGQVDLPIPGLEDGLEFPVTAVIAGERAVALAEFATGRSTTRLRLDATPSSTIDADAVDAAHPTSARGPVPLPPSEGGPLKPDLSAPGTDILSANTADDGSPAGYVLATGTSMASPHVAGAAAVLRAARPAWRPDDIHAALVGSAEPVVQVDGAPAPATVQGAGRLHLDRALDATALLAPPAWDLGAISRGEAELELELRDARLAPEGAVTWLPTAEAGVSPAPLTPALPNALRLEEGGRTRFTLRWDLGGLPPGEYDGRVAFREGKRVLRFTWRLRIPEAARDVLLLQVRRQRAGDGGGGFPGLPGLPGGGGFADGPDYAEHWTEALDALGLRYDVWTVAEGQRAGTPPLSTLRRYRLVLLAAGDGDAPLDALPGGMTALQMYLLSGGRLMASGWNLPHELTASLDLQNSGSMHVLPRYFAGFDRIADDVAPAGALRPSRLFASGRIELATSATADAAGNGGAIDLGRPLAEIVTAADGAQAPPDLGIASPLVADRAIARARPVVEIDGQGAALIEVSGDARLSAPTRDPAIPWRALFAGFGLEAVTERGGSLSREAMLADLWRWATESDEVHLRLVGPAGGEAGDWLDYRVEVEAPPEVEIVDWLWDAGDGRPHIRSTEPTLRLRYAAQGERMLRVEATTRGGHSHVGETALRIAGGPVYLPRMERGRR